MADIEKATPELQLLDERMQDFKNLLMADDNTTVGPLWKAWHYLQVYSIWSLRLPSTDAALQLALGINEPMSYSFYIGMLNSLKSVHDAAQEFTSNLFPRVVKVGQSIRTFGEDAKATEDGTFSAIIELINEKGAEADIVSLIQGLREQAAANATEAKVVNGLLQDYSDLLRDATDQMAAVQLTISADDRTSNEAIAILEGGPEDEGSIANIQQMMDADMEEYEKDVILASTSPVYSIFWPFGLIATVVMASVYGDRAVKRLDKYDQEKAILESKEEELRTAYQTKSVATAAQTGITKTKAFTDLAIEQTAIVQQAWEGVSRSLDLILQKITKMTTQRGEQERLRAKSQVKNYARRCSNQWRMLWPAIDQLTSRPYITVDPNPLSIQDTIQAIQAANDDLKNT